jgi:hypothetical protein
MSGAFSAQSDQGMRLQEWDDVMYFTPKYGITKDSRETYCP